MRLLPIAGGACAAAGTTAVATTGVPPAPDARAGGAPAADAPAAGGACAADAPAALATCSHASSFFFFFSDCSPPMAFLMEPIRRNSAHLCPGCRESGACLHVGVRGALHMQLHAWAYARNADQRTSA